MKTLILYLSHDGQTKKIAEHIAHLMNGEVCVQPLNETKRTEDFFAVFDRIIIGAAVRYGHFDRRLYAFIEQHLVLLNSKPSAFFSVNLTARKLGKDTPETNVYVRKFLQRITWQPKLVAVFAGALYYPRYKWFDRIMIQLIMKLTGGETDPTKEIEYTNWQKVNEFAVKLNQMH